MSDHLAPDEMNRYAFRALDPGALLSADDHLAGCGACRARLVDEAGLGTTVRSLAREVAAARRPEPDHLSYEAVEAMAEDRLRGAAREVADLHVEGCAACSGEVADLRGFVAAHREARRAAAAAAAAGHAGEGIPVRGAPGIGPSLHGGAAGAASPAPVPPEDAADAAGASGAGDTAAASPLSLPSARRPGRLAPAFAAAAAVLLVAVAAGVVATRALRRERDQLAVRIQDLTRQNETLAAHADAAMRSRADLERRAAEAAQAAGPGPVTLQDRRGRDAAIAVGLDDDSQLIGLDALPLAEARLVAVALRRGAVEIPAEVLALVRDDIGGAPGPVLAAPVGVAIRGVRPTFSWRPLDGATGYTLTVLEESGEVALRGGPTRATMWTPPRPLRRGATYVWSVAALLPAEPAEPPGPGPAGVAAEAGAPGEAPAPAATLVSARARFRVLDAGAAAALDRALRAASGSRLAAGVFLARAGLLDEAIGELRALAAANPHSDLARSLLASVETAHTAR